MKKLAPPVFTGSDNPMQTYLPLPQHIKNAEPTGRVDMLQAGGRENLQSEMREENLDENILNMLKVMSHDIRGSLVSLSATLKLLSRGYYGRMEEGVANCLKEVLSKTIGLIGLAEEHLIRTFSFNDYLEMDQELLDLKQDIIDPVIEEFSSEIKHRHIQIHNCFDAISFRFFVKGGKIWLKTIFRNLLKNAIKYGDVEGKVSFGFEESGSSLRFNVYNSGKPVSQENRGKLFTKFAPIGKSENESANGMGLGLYLIKRIIENHGGEIWYEAREDGSNFVFTLPRECLKNHE